MNIRMAFIAVSLLLLGAPPATAGEASDPMAVVQAHVAALNTHDIPQILATLGETLALSSLKPDGTWQDLGKADRAQQQKNYERAHQFHPNSRFHIQSAFVSGEYVTTRETVSGLTGLGLGEGLTIYRVVDGKIVAMWLIETMPVAPAK